MHQITKKKSLLHAYSLVKRTMFTSSLNRLFSLHSSDTECANLLLPIFFLSRIAFDFMKQIPDQIRYLLDKVV